MRAGLKADRNTNGVILDAIVAVAGRNGFCDVEVLVMSALGVFASGVL